MNTVCFFSSEFMNRQICSLAKWKHTDFSYTLFLDKFLHLYEGASVHPFIRLLVHGLVTEKWNIWATIEQKNI